MTINEFIRIDFDQIFSFKLYYGEVKTGIIIEDIMNEGDYYIIRPPQIKQYNNNELDLKKDCFKINLDSIVSWEVCSTENKSWNNKRQKDIVVSAKKMVIFGAGASHDFSYDKAISPNKKPPLTYQLFDDIYNPILTEYKGATVLANEILQMTDIEKYFQIQWENIKKHYDPDLLNKIINTQFYIQHLFQFVSNNCQDLKRNNYSILTSLLSRYNVVSKQKVLLVTFNYDTLLEQSLQRGLQYEYDEIEDYIDKDKKVLLFKPHGSWNWIRPYKMQLSLLSKNEYRLFCDSLYSEKANYAEIFDQISDEIKIKQQLNLKELNNENYKFLPQLLIPFTDKDDFVMPIEHRRCLEGNISQIEEILIIGWKGTEEVFKDLLKKHIGKNPVKITVVNKGDLTIQKSFEDTLPNAIWKFEDTFTSYMNYCLHNEDHFFST